MCKAQLSNQHSANQAVLLINQSSLTTAMKLGVVKNAINLEWKSATLEFRGCKGDAFIGRGGRRFLSAIRRQVQARFVISSENLLAKKTGDKHLNNPSGLDREWHGGGGISEKEVRKDWAEVEYFALLSFFYRALLSEAERERRRGGRKNSEGEDWGRGAAPAYGRRFFSSPDVRLASTVERTVRNGHVAGCGMSWRNAKWLSRKGRSPLTMTVMLFA